VNYEFIDVERNGHLLTITINRPEVRNALHPPASHEMSQAFDEFSADPELWVAILTATGEASFSAGNDLKYVMEHGFDPDAFPDTGFGGLTHRFDCWKPIIGAANGSAQGGGLELLLACDLILAADDATFGLTETRIGAAPFGGGLVQLPRKLGLPRAAEMVFTGRRASAEELHAAGLVHEVVPREQLPAATQELADRILACAPLAVQACKQVMIEALDRPLQDALTTRYDALEALTKTEDIVEGAMAFAQKRDPVWKGR
jgi:crotonobetainyl-CoA hydratase